MRRDVVRFALTGFVGVWVAGCSADATRISESPFSNPFATASNEPAAPTPQASATPLAAATAPNPAYVVAAHPSPVVTASLPPTPAPPTTGQILQPVGGSAAGWSAVGGSPIIVAQGEDLDGLSRRYGVPTAALLSANGLRSPSEVRVGMRLVVPVYDAAARTASTEARPAKAKHAEVAESETPKPRKGEGKKSEEKKDKSKSAKAKHDSEDANSSDDVKSKLEKKSKKKTAESEHSDAKHEKSKSVAEAPVAKSEKVKSVAEAPAGKTEKSKAVASTKAAAKAAPAVAEAEPAVKSSKKKPATDMSPNGAVAAPAAPAASTKTQAEASATPEFRWPARGRIIQGFKSGGNDGINIAVPEGTSVRAAEDGKVAYAGSALKGYGNLVLIRHPNGFVTAYANNGELDVKNGDTVKRGQVIAKSGQSGDVSSPQLHFELRKGSTPVDPTNYLAGL
jgi:murein DD-endopeptidase MepM/ murein hydrolase activator NlpD